MNWEGGGGVITNENVQMYKCSYKLVVTNDKPLLAANIGKCYSDTNEDDNNGDNNSITLSITGVNPIYTNNFHLSPKIQTNVVTIAYLSVDLPQKHWPITLLGRKSIDVWCLVL